MNTGTQIKSRGRNRKGPQKDRLPLLRRNLTCFQTPIASGRFPPHQKTRAYSNTHFTNLHDQSIYPLRPETEKREGEKVEN